MYASAQGGSPARPPCQGEAAAWAGSEARGNRNDEEHHQEEARDAGLRFQQHPGPRGRRARPAPPRHVHRHHQLQGSASPRHGGRRQRRRRGYGRSRDEDRRHDPRRRQRLGAGRRRRYPRQADPAGQGPPARRGGGAHHAERGWEVRGWRLLDLRWAARRRCLGRERPVGEDDGRHPARRLRVAPGVRPGPCDDQAGQGQGEHQARDHGPVLARSGDLHRDRRIQARAAHRAPARARVPERRPRDPPGGRA